MRHIMHCMMLLPRFMPCSLQETSLHLTCNLVEVNVGCGLSHEYLCCACCVQQACIMLTFSKIE